MELSRITEILNGDKEIYLGAPENRLDLIKFSDKGISKSALANLAGFLSFPMSRMAEILPVTERTIQRYAPEDRFNSIVSEHILQIAEVAARGVETFGDKERFLSWMKHSSTALGNRMPMELLSSRFGVEMILDELGRIEYGVYA